MQPSKINLCSKCGMSTYDILPTCKCDADVLSYYPQEKNGRSSLLTTEVARTAERKHIPRLLSILDKKQHDYGPSNITRHGQLGVIVRMDDKLARLQNLLTNKTLPNNESISDSWDDLANYGIIGTMLAKGDWPKS